jgi:hypothetical protein
MSFLSIRDDFVSRPFISRRAIAEVRPGYLRPTGAIALRLIWSCLAAHRCFG